MSDSTMSALRPARRSSIAATPFAEEKSASITVTPETGSIGRRSIATTAPAPPTRFAATCDQPPGAAPRSTTTIPGFKSLSRSSISVSLYAERDR